MKDKLNLKDVTLLGVDTVNKGRLMEAFKICEHYAEFGDKKLLTKTDVNYTTESGIKVLDIKNINSLNDYSYFMIKKSNDFVETDYVLIVQHDGFILNPEAWQDDFLKYDYIGAPWWYNDNCNVGNGGFSLRSKKLLQILQKDNNIFETTCEDYNICRTYGNYLKEKGIRFAPENLAKEFSIEGNMHGGIKNIKLGDYNNVWDGEFGFHGLQKTDISKWSNPLKR